MIITKTKRKPVPYKDNHKYINNIIHKLCSDCDEWKPLDECYYNNKKAPDGHNPYCKECTKRRSSKWIKENPERYKEIRKGTEEKPRTKLLKRKMSQKLRAEGVLKNWQKNNPDKVYMYGRNRTMNKTHEISKEEWENCLNYFDNSCAYCGLSEIEHKDKHNQKLHKEHADPNGANDLSNNIPACKICNSKKHDYSLEEWYREDNALCESYSYDRLQKILKWLNDDYKLYIQIKL